MNTEQGREQKTNITAELEVKDWLDVFPEDFKMGPDGEFFFSLTFDVGEVGQDASFMFQVMVMSPDMSRKPENRHLKRIVLHELDVPKLRNEIETVVREAAKKSAYDWAHVLTKRFYWEYE